MSKISIEVGEATLRLLVIEHLRAKLGDVSFRPEDVRIEVKSKQNWKSEWEAAHYRAMLDVSL